METEVKRQGVIIPNGVLLEAHELSTVVLFTKLGYDVELIPRSNTEGVHRSDMIMNGLEWEIKAPKGEGKSLIKNTVQKALRQSANIVIDLRRVKRRQEKCIIELKREFALSRSVKRMVIIKKSGEMIDLNK